jgi:hypothetical protein
MNRLISAEGLPIGEVMSVNSQTEAARSWAPIVGRWSTEPERVRYLGPQDEGFKPPFGICVTNADFSDGSVSTSVSLSQSSDGASFRTEGKVLLGYRSPEERYVMAGLGGWHRAYTIGEFDPGFGWRALAIAGMEENLSPGQLYSLQVTLTGQRVSVTVDSVRVLAHVLEKPLTGGQVGLFAVGNGMTDFSDFSITSRPGRLFVVMQFSERYQQLHEEVIKPVADDFKLQAYHAGEVFGPGMILQDIAQGIVDAKVVIAEITPANESRFNANVFYEIGYAHALGKPTILLAERERIKQLPFDISGYRVLFYDNTIAGKTQIQAGLRKHLEAILAESSGNGA